MAFAYYKNTDENTVTPVTKQWADERSPFHIK